MRRTFHSWVEPYLLTLFVQGCLTLKLIFTSQVLLVECFNHHFSRGSHMSTWNPSSAHPVWTSVFSYKNSDPIKAFQIQKEVGTEDLQFVVAKHSKTVKTVQWRRAKAAFAKWDPTRVYGLFITKFLECDVSPESLKCLCPVFLEHQWLYSNIVVCH